MLTSQAKQSSELGLSVAKFTLGFEIRRYINCGPLGLTVCGGSFEISMVAHAKMTSRSLSNQDS